MVKIKLMDFKIKFIKVDNIGTKEEEMEKYKLNKEKQNARN